MTQNHFYIKSVIKIFFQKLPKFLHASETPYFSTNLDCQKPDSITCHF